MSKFNFKDYGVRVWGQGVFIDSPGSISYWGEESGKGIQINSLEDEDREKVLESCNKIREEFLKLDKMIRDIDSNY